MSTSDTSSVNASRSRSRRGPAKKSGGLSLVKEIAIVVLGAVVVSSVIKAFLFQMFIIPSESMFNTLQEGDRVVVSKVSTFDRGNVVVFKDPGNWLPDAPTEQPTPLDRVLEFIGIPTATTPGHLIKRVIGMPGDRVICCDEDDRVTVNGYPLDETTYLYTDGTGVQAQPSKVRFEVVVPQDRIFVMGDNRSVSADSRCHLDQFSAGQGQGQVAFVPMSDVVGPALAIVAPFGRAARLPVPQTFTGVPPPKDPAPTEAVIKPKGVSC